VNVDGVVPPAVKAGASPAFREVARGFEAFLLRALLKSMRRALPRSGFPGGGTGGDVFAGLLDAQWAERAASRGTGMGTRLVERYAPGPGESRGVHIDLRDGVYWPG